MVPEKTILEYLFLFSPVWLPWQPGKLCILHKFLVVERETFLWKICQNICNDIATNTNFQYFHFSQWEFKVAITTIVRK